MLSTEPGNEKERDVRTVDTKHHSSSSDHFRPKSLRRLALWEEYRDEFPEITTFEDEILLRSVNSSVILPLSAGEALQSAGLRAGDLVSVILTDDPDKPVRVTVAHRRVEKQAELPPRSSPIDYNAHNKG